MWLHIETFKNATGQRDDFTTGSSLDYCSFKKTC